MTDFSLGLLRNIDFSRSLSHEARPDENFLPRVKAPADLFDPRLAELYENLTLKHERQGELNRLGASEYMEQGQIPQTRRVQYTDRDQPTSPPPVSYSRRPRLPRTPLELYHQKRENSARGQPSAPGYESPSFARSSSNLDEFDHRPSVAAFPVLSAAKHACSKCDGVFAHSEDLRRHLQIHGEPVANAQNFCLFPDCRRLAKAYPEHEAWALYCDTHTEIYLEVHHSSPNSDKQNQQNKSSLRKQPPAPGYEFPSFNRSSHTLDEFDSDADSDYSRTIRLHSTTSGGAPIQSAFSSEFRYADFEPIHEHSRTHGDLAPNALYSCDVPGYERGFADKEFLRRHRARHFDPERTLNLPPDSDKKIQQNKSSSRGMDHLSPASFVPENNFNQIAIATGNMTISRDETLTKETKDARKLKNALGFGTSTLRSRPCDRQPAVSGSKSHVKPNKWGLFHKAYINDVQQDLTQLHGGPEPQHAILDLDSGAQDESFWHGESRKQLHRNADSKFDFRHVRDSDQLPSTRYARDASTSPILPTTLNVNDWFEFFGIPNRDFNSLYGLSAYG